jgi:hypothetical protein
MVSKTTNQHMLFFVLNVGQRKYALSACRTILKGPFFDPSQEACLKQSNTT